MEMGAAGLNEKQRNGEIGMTDMGDGGCWLSFFFFSFCRGNRFCFSQIKIHKRLTVASLAFVKYYTLLCYDFSPLLLV